MASELVKIAADFSTTLVTKVAVGATTATLTSATDDDGVALPAGTYGFTIDRNSANKEYFTATLSGTSLTDVKTVTRGTGVGTSGFALAHRKGAEVIISDHVALKRMLDLLDGTTNLDSSNPLQYTAEPTFTYGQHELVTWDKSKDYTDGVAIAGAPDASTTVKGIVKLTAAPVSATDPIAVGDNDTRFVTQSGTALSGSNKVIDNADVSDAGASGKIVRASGTSLPALDGSNLTEVQLKSTFTAQESISAGNAVVIGSGSNTSQQTVGSVHSSGSGVENTYWFSQKFTTIAGVISIKSINIYAGSSGSINTTASIRADSAGKPTGADIGGYTGTVNVTTTSGVYTITFSTPVPVSSSTDYHVVLRASNSSVSWGRANTPSTGANASTDSGSTWSANNGPFELYVNYINTVSGQISKASATLNGDRSNNFIGFAVSGISAGASGLVIVGGVVSGLSGLTPGQVYYLSDTSGAISTSSGTISRKVGIAISATELLIKHDNV